MSKKKGSEKMNFEGEPISEIKEYAKYLGLKVSGRRNEVIERINKHLKKRDKQ